MSENVKSILKKFLIALAIIFILLLGNVKGMYNRLFFYTFGTNVDIIISDTVNKPIHDDKNGIIGYELQNNQKVFDKYDGDDKWIYCLEDETKLCDSEGDFVKFFGDGDKIYYVKPLWSSLRYANDGFYNTVIHNKDIVYCFDTSSKQTTEILNTDKHLWTLYADNDVILLFDSDNKNIIARDTKNGETIATEDLSEKMKNDIEFTVYDGYVSFECGDYEGVFPDNQK